MEVLEKADTIKTHNTYMQNSQRHVKILHLASFYLVSLFPVFSQEKFVFSFTICLGGGALCSYFLLFKTRHIDTEDIGQLLACLLSMHEATCLISDNTQTCHEAHAVMSAHGR